jgi:hypothetical protein
MSATERRQRRMLHRLARIPPAARRDLLRALLAPSNVRADLIRQAFEKDRTRSLAEALTDIEVEGDEARLRLVDLIRDLERDER